MTTTTMAPTTTSTERKSRLRLHFTAEDLLRIRVLDTPDPMWELVLSLFKLHSHSAEHSAWYKMISKKLGEQQLSQTIGMLSELVPAQGNFPDFLTPHPASEGFDCALEQIQATPRNELFTDLDPKRLDRQPGSFGKAIGTADRSALNELASALRRYHDTLLGPYWDTVNHAVRADAALRSRQLTTSGAGAMLSQLGPTFRWAWPVLETRYKNGRDVHLEGRGLLLVATHFCIGNPVTLIDNQREPVLVYQALGAKPARGPVTLAEVLPELGGILGHTRTRILVALQTARTTTALAEQTGVSLATASQQLALLREAALVRSRREGQAMVHSLDKRGHRLLARD